MKELKGKYADAKIFTDDVEDAALEQIQTLLDQEFSAGSHPRFMPDVHAGAGCTIGTTMIISDKVCPNITGIDLGCGVLTVELGKIDIDLKAFDEVVHKYVPSGFAVHESPLLEKDVLDFMRKNMFNPKIFSEAETERALCSIGTLGGGNHFIELDKDDEGSVYLVIHSGSRNMGVKVCNYYQKKAIEMKTGKNSPYGIAAKKLIEKLKAEERQQDIDKELKELRKQYQDSIPDELAYLDKNYTDDFDNYLKDVSACQIYARFNRGVMAQEIIGHYIMATNSNIKSYNYNHWYVCGRVGMPYELSMHALGKGINDLYEFFTFDTIHNYIDFPKEGSNGLTVLRKGAVSAKFGETLLIPLNMRDGSLICLGKGNPDWNWSAPHGAGRKMSRKKAKESLSLQDFEDSMKNVYSTTVCQGTIDEAPMAYKDADEIIENIKDTVDVWKRIYPIYNFKAEEQTAPWKKGKEADD